MKHSGVARSRNTTGRFPLADGDGRAVSGRRFRLLWLAGIVLCSLSAPALRADDESPLRDAQQRMKEALQRIVVPQGLLTDSPDIRAAFREVVAGPKNWTARIRSDGRQVALGTIVGADGWVLTKASQVTEDVACEFADGRKLPAEVVGTHLAYDLALLKVDAQDLPVAQWPSAPPAVGQFAATPSLESDPLTIGVISVKARRIPRTSGVLGILLEEDEKGVRIGKVLPDSGAARAGLRIGDIVTHCNEIRTKQRVQLVRAVRKFAPGDEITLTILRDGKKQEVAATLTRTVQGMRQSRGEKQNSMGSKLSQRRFGFPLALQHDSVVPPTDCGGPLVNLDSQLIGINIARAGRTETYALPADTIRSLLPELMSGALAPGSPESLATRDITSLRVPGAERTVKVPAAGRGESGSAGPSDVETDGPDGTAPGSDLREGQPPEPR